MEYLIGAVWVLLELLSFCLFCDAFLPQPRNKVKYAVAFLAFWVVIYICTNFGWGTPIQQIVAFCLYSGLSFYLYRGRWLRHFLIVVLFFIFAAAVDTAMVYGASMSIGIGYSELVWRKLTYTIVVTLGKLLEVLIAYLTHLLQPSTSKQRIYKKWLWLTLLFPAVSLFLLTVIFHSYKNEADLSIGSFILCNILGLANVAIIYLVRMMEKSSQKEQEMLLVNQQMEIQTQSILDLEKSYRIQRQATHEYQRQLQAIHDLIIIEQITAAKEYIEELQDKQASHLFTVNCRHPIIDVILNHKYQIAKEHNIEIQIQINDLSQVNISTNALVVLLSNLLDNAIEACVRMDGARTIYCSLQLNGSLFLSIRNTTPPVSIVDGVIQTSKAVKHDHGFGLISIRHILDNLQAEYTYHYENGWFQFVAEIPMP